jgi:hypothetical protein
MVPARKKQWRRATIGLSVVDVTQLQVRRAMAQLVHRDEVFVAGGQPSITYVQREELHMERQLTRAIAAPNQIFSLSGPTKTGKTVLCRKVLGDREYVWIDGGEIKSSEQFWERVSSELSIPHEAETVEERETTKEVGTNVAIVTANGSRLYKRSSTARRQINAVEDAIRALLASGIILVIDDFHYIDKDTRVTLMRNVK